MSLEVFLKTSPERAIPRILKESIKKRNNRTLDKEFITERGSILKNSDSRRSLEVPRHFCRLENLKT